MKKLSVILLSICAMLFAACEATNTDSLDETTTEVETKKETPATTKVLDGYVVSEEGTAKETPEDGKANVQGKVLFNEKPAVDVEVKLCETFSTIVGCSGEEYKTKTDENGVYLFKNLDPKDYEGLLARVFKTPMYVFATGNISIVSAKYKVEADKTFFAPPTNLFKSDLKIESPKSKAKVDTNDFEIKWKKYEEAAYYKFSLYADEATVTSPYINEKVEGESFRVDKPLEVGSYKLQMDAYNVNDVKLSQLKEDIKFTVTKNSPPKIDDEETKPSE